MLPFRQLLKCELNACEPRIHREIDAVWRFYQTFYEYRLTASTPGTTLRARTTDTMHTHRTIMLHTRTMTLSTTVMRTGLINDS